MVQHLAVGLAKGQLAFLCTKSGALSGTLAGAGRTPPAADPWLGLIWTVSHERQLLVCRAPGGRGMATILAELLFSCPLCRRCMAPAVAWRGAPLA